MRLYPLKIPIASLEETRKLLGRGKTLRSGVTFDYYLNKNVDSLELTLEVLQNSEVIRTYTNKKDPNFKSWPGGPSKPQVLGSKKGVNRFTWDFRRDPLPSIHKVFIFGGLADLAWPPESIR